MTFDPFLREHPFLDGNNHPTIPHTMWFEKIANQGVTTPPNIPLTVSKDVQTNSDGDLTSVVNTGSNLNVMSASPTFTGTITAAVANFSGAVGIGTNSPDAKTEISESASNITVLKLVNTNTATGSAKLILFHDSASPADNDAAGDIQFSSKNDADQETVIANILTRIIDVTDGTEDGIIAFSTMGNGTRTEAMRIDESQQVGIGDTTPSFKLDVNGTFRVVGVAQLDSNLTVAGFVRLAQKAGTAVDGDVWHDSTRNALQTFVSGIEQTLTGCIFTQTADQTIADTTTETTMFGTGVGTLTLPANFWVVGKTIRMEIHGDFADTGNPTAEIQAYYGATSLIDSGAITLSGLTSTEEWECRVIITCRSVGATGTVETVIDWEYETTTGSSAIERLDVAGVLQTIDTTAAGALDVTFQWGAANASNTLTSEVAFVEVLN